MRKRDAPGCNVQIGDSVIGLSDLPALVQDYENGSLLWRDTYASLLHLLAQHEVGVISSGLSPALAARFQSRLHDDFADEAWDDPEVWNGTAVWIDNAGGEHADRRRIVARIRDWMRSIEGLRIDAKDAPREGRSG